MLSRRRDIFKCPGPPSTRMADAPVFHIPRCQAQLRERRREMSDVFQISHRPPVSAVNYDRHRVGARARGYPQIPKLMLAIPIRNARVRRRRGDFNYLFFACQRAPLGRNELPQIPMRHPETLLIILGEFVSMIRIAIGRILMLDIHRA